MFNTFRTMFFRSVILCLRKRLRSNDINIITRNIKTSTLHDGTLESCKT